MSPESYRYYCLDSSGRLHNADWLQADSDEEAISLVKAKHSDARRCEIWQGQRLVAAIAAPERSSVVAEGLRTFDEARRMLGDAAAHLTNPGPVRGEAH